MDQTVQESFGAFAAMETWSADEHVALVKELVSAPNAPQQFRKLLGQLESANPDPRGAAALKIGIARYMLCRFDDALTALSGATDNKDRCYFQGLCHKSLRQYDKAAEAFIRAADRGWNGAEAELHAIEARVLGGDVEGAGKALSKVSGKGESLAQYWFVLGLVRELAGDGEAAVQSYQKARQIEPNHVCATFRLAYYFDLHGEEEQAIELYRQVVSRPPVHANALMNLAVLYEDLGRYDHAMACLRRVLVINPGHLRARLFARDVDASRTMYYDEDQARRIAKRNAVLDIPVTDFELSVRARNCLKKMNIRTLGDLVRTSEQELLSYKNFGETSLKEIKDMLTAKGLRLGQALEDAAALLPPAPAMMAAPAEPATSGDGTGYLPLEQIEFSIRARRALEGLRLRTLGELASRTEAELLACKNFGQTSLNEVRQRLAEYGMKLREIG